MRGNALRRDGTRLCDGGNTDIAQRDSGSWWFRRSAGWSDTEPTMNPRVRWNCALSKPRKLGRIANQRLNLTKLGRAQGRKAKTPNRTWEIRPYGIIGGPRETRSWRKCEPTLQPKGPGW
jgi:hypothetical protein